MKSLICLISFLFSLSVFATITVTAPKLSPSINEYGPATITDENGHVIPAMAMLVVDSSGNTGSSILTVTEGIVSQVTGRKNPPMASLSGGSKIPLMALVTVDSSAHVVPFAIPKSAVGLSNVDNTSDVNKPISSAVSTALSGKQATGNYITSLTSEVTASGPGAASATLSNSAVIGKVLTGYAAGAGTISALDSILSAIQKLDGNNNAYTPIQSSDWNGDPTSLRNAIDRIAAQVKILSAGTPIP